MGIFKSWRQDLQASLVVFLVALPLCLGIALASGAPLASGLIAGIIGGLVIGLLSGSHLSVSGPAAGLTVIVITAINDLGSYEAFALAVLISGLFQIMFGMLRLGKIGNFFPSSVIKGMLAAIGIILILKQIPHAVGYDADFMGDESFIQRGGENTFTGLLHSLQAFHYGSVLVALISLSIMLFWEIKAIKGIKIFQLIPGALVAVLSSVLLNETLFSSSSLYILNEHLVTLPFEGGFKDLVDNIHFPNLSFLSMQGVYISALTIAIVGSLESLLSIEAADKIDPHKRVTNKDRELLAQGVGNALSGFVGGLPVTAVIVRTSANLAAGAKSKLSAVFHGVWLLLSIVLIPHILNKIPLATLAAILILVGYKLTKPKIILEMYQKGKDQFIPFAVTILAILFTDLLWGIGIGMVVGFIFVIRANTHKSIVKVQDGDRYLIKFYKDASFIHKASLGEMLNTIPRGSFVTIDGASSIYIDADIVDLIKDFLERARETDIVVDLKKSSLALSPFFKE